MDSYSGVYEKYLKGYTRILEIAHGKVSHGITFETLLFLGGIYLP